MRSSVAHQGRWGVRRSPPSEAGRPSFAGLSGVFAGEDRFPEPQLQPPSEPLPEHPVGRGESRAPGDRGPQTGRRGDIAHLLEAIEQVERRSAGLFEPAPVAPTGWSEVDRTLTPGAAAGTPGADDATDATDATVGGLTCGAIHEWFGLMGGEHPRCRLWLPPVAVLAHLAGRSLEAGSGSWVVWVGRRCWPYPRSFRGREGARLLARSIFVDAETIGERVWAIDLALRSRAVAAVVGDGHGLSMSESRRLQLAAGTGRTLGLLARPICDLGEISAAWTRWRVAPAPSTNAEPRWTIELLRCKGTGVASEEARRWVVRRDHATGSLDLAGDVPDRSRTPARCAPEEGLARRIA